MTDIKISRPHSFGKAGARARVESFLDKVPEMGGLKWTWNGDVCNFSGPASGQLVVGESNIDIEVKLGFAAKLLKGKIEARLQEGIEKALS